MLAPGLIKLHKRMVDLHGDKAIKWFDHLPQLLQKYSDLWEIKILDPAQDLSYNLVMYAEKLKDQSKVIFKAGIPNPSLANEITSLKYFAGHGCVKILHYDQQDGVMLIEQAIPGSTLATLTMNGLDDQAIYICVDIIDMLHANPAILTPDLRNIPKLSDRSAEYILALNTLQSDAQKYSQFDLDLLYHGRDLFNKLSSTTKDTVVLHGDLHHYNILSATRQPWLAIDPHGVIGDRTFEVAPFICNPAPHVTALSDLAQLLYRRIDLFSELLSYDKQRIIEYTLAHAILVAAQSLIDHGEDWQGWQLIAQLLKG